MSILVTGGAGFIGSYVTKGLLNDGHKVIVVDNFSSGMKENLPVSPSVKIITTDISEDTVVEVLANEKIEAIIHLAAQASVPLSVKEPIYDMNINIKGTLNMLSLAERLKVKAFVFASTAAVYGNQTVLPINEDTLLYPETPYGISKLAAEYYIKSICNQHNINYTILRFANVYGPKQSDQGEGGVVKIFCEQLLKNNRPTIFGDGLQTRDFIYVEDIASATIKALNGKNETMNVSTNSEVSINDIYELIQKACKTKITPIYSDVREGDIYKSRLDNKVITRELNWSPTVQMDEGIKRTIDEIKAKSNN
jgi:UDP-glucose 4-epimerase